MSLRKLKLSIYEVVTPRGEEEEEEEEEGYGGIVLFSKRWYRHTRLHGVITLKTTI